MLLTEKLVQGVDLWINTPRRPWEACGTSGMKVLVNGGLNLSELDGWWAEAYHPDIGWALGDGQERGEDPSSDHQEAERLYSLLENEIIPLFYKRDKDGLPREWLKKVRASMARLTPYYSAVRTVQEYTTKYYLPCALSYTETQLTLFPNKKKRQDRAGPRRSIKKDKACPRKFILFYPAASGRSYHPVFI